MATDKLVDFDHVTDYISREAAIKKITALINESGKYTAYESGADDACYIIEHEIPAADVRPVAEISDAVDEAIDFLSSVSSQMPYHVYSALFDLICGICPNCGADMREVDADGLLPKRTFFL